MLVACVCLSGGDRVWEVGLGGTAVLFTEVTMGNTVWGDQQVTAEVWPRALTCHSAVWSLSHFLQFSLVLSQFYKYYGP